MEMVERTADFFPSLEQVTPYNHLRTHSIQLRLEVRILQRLKIDKSGLIEVPFARTLLQRIGYLLSNLLVLLDHVIHVNIFGLILSDLWNA